VPHGPEAAAPHGPEAAVPHGPEAAAAHGPEAAAPHGPEAAAAHRREHAFLGTQPREQANPPCRIPLIRRAHTKRREPKAEKSHGQHHP
jgi:hypothetical protein